MVSKALEMGDSTKIKKNYLAGGTQLDPNMGKSYQKGLIGPWEMCLM